VDFCGDRRIVRPCAQRLGGRARVSTLDEATPNSGTVVFVDSKGVQRSLDILSAPFGLAASEVRDTAIAVDILDDAGKTTGVRFHVMHPVVVAKNASGAIMRPSNSGGATHRRVEAR
jgi:hypothetical protein